LLIYLSWDTYSAYKRQSAAREVPPMPPDGWYRVASIKKDGKPVPALPLDDCRWRTFYLRGNFVSLRSVDGTASRFIVDGDPLKGPVALYPADENRRPIKGASASGSLNLTVTDGPEACLRGVINGHAFEAALLGENPGDFPLMSRGFHWISEAPYFR